MHSLAVFIYLKFAVQFYYNISSGRYLGIVQHLSNMRLCHFSVVIIYNVYLNYTISVQLLTNLCTNVLSTLPKINMISQCTKTNYLNIDSFSWLPSPLIYVLFLAFCSDMCQWGALWSHPRRGTLRLSSTLDWCQLHDSFRCLPQLPLPQWRHLSTDTRIVQVRVTLLTFSLLEIPLPHRFFIS